ncbi:hypothetical protein TeGR_g11962 [Tetraparma gracilis]|uniref:MJ1316 RNA cyclic group end recognition domain-containing protein n=1 Tax=Tetraparma gracilis TaxID=2962635 RepID=A0ABQ6M9T5_9STRA|nr:hypothetical protein TeGR_g11962 [Tetraparma gracilis]
MRTSSDVISRVLHDPSMGSPDSIIVGYWDGIAGKVLEKPLSKFSCWGDIAMASLHALAIPQHRIRYFKHGPSETMLWHKADKLDLIFGSTLPFKKVTMKELDEMRGAPPPLPSAPAPPPTPLQAFLSDRQITDFDEIRAVLTGPGFGCRVRSTNNLYSVMYDEMRSSFTSQALLSQQDAASRALDHCRGVIYEKGTNKLVCMAFHKFWESYDDRSAASVLDWSSAVAAEKADGMLTKLYRYNDQWRIASNGMINADKATLRSAGPNVTVGSLFRDAANCSIPGGFSALLASLDPSRTYAFELLHPAHRIVCYQRSPRLIHLCTRVQSSGEEIYDDNLTLVPRPAAVSVAGGLAALQARASSLSSQGEGFVVRDGQNRRIKVKGSEYLRAHREEDRLNSNVWFHVCSAYLLPGKLSSSMSWQALLPAGFDKAGCAAFLRGALRTVCGEGVSETEGKAELVRSLARREVFEAIVYGGVEEMRGVEKVLAPATAAVPDSLAACLDTHDVVIMRGLPGAGKSTHIAMVRAERPDLVFRVASADDYFVDPISGSYNFDRANLPDAHSHCRSVARAAVAAGQKVIIDNTNSTVKEMAPYLDLAATFRLKAVVFELDCDGPEEAALMAGRNQHGVPLSGVERMLSGWESAPQGVQVVRARRVAAGLVEVLRKLHEKSQLLYAAVFLDPASKRKLAQMRRPEHLEIQDGDHATIAFHRKFPNTPSFFAQLAGVVGKKVQMEVTHLAADHGLAAAAVSCADSGVMGVAALAGHKEFFDGGWLMKPRKGIKTAAWKMEAISEMVQGEGGEGGEVFVWDDKEENRRALQNSSIERMIVMDEFSAQ